MFAVSHVNVSCASCAREGETDQRDMRQMAAPVSSLPCILNPPLASLSLAPIMPPISHVGNLVEKV